MEEDETPCAAADGAVPPEEVVCCIATLVDVDDDEEAAGAPPALLATPAPTDLVCAILAVENVAELIATVDKVVPTPPAPAGATAIAPIFGNDPAPQRHWQLQEPSAWRVP